jgi:hypothetical protein
MAKKSIIDMGNYLYSKKEFEAYRWCIENGIYITPKAKSTSQWYLTIEINKKINVSPDSYGKMDIWRQMYKYYIYYYDKYKK